MNRIIHLNENELNNKLSKPVRGTAGETLNKLLDEGADQMTGAKKYEQT